MENPLEVKVGRSYKVRHLNTVLTCVFELEDWNGNDRRFLMVNQDGQKRNWSNAQGELVGGSILEYEIHIQPRNSCKAA